MIKRFILIIVILVNSLHIFATDFPTTNWGLSLGMFYTEQEAGENDLTISAQVDSISLFLMNMKFGSLVRFGYYFDGFFAVGLESGLIFNSYQINLPLRSFVKLGSSNINLKVLGGISLNREVSDYIDGLPQHVIAGTLECGIRLDLFNLYFEYMNSKSYNSLISDSMKISFGYTIYLPNI